MTAAGLDPDSLTVVESYEHLPTSGGAAAEVALSVNPRITALMCTADVLALSAMDHLRAHGIYVPGQMTVTGFDGVPEALRRGLTTVVQSSLEKGRSAGQLLHNPPRSGLPVIRGAGHRTGTRPDVRPARLATSTFVEHVPKYRGDIVGRPDAELGRCLTRADLDADIAVAHPAETPSRR